MKTQLLSLIVMACIQASAVPALAAGPPTEPILRIETGMHTAVIKSIGTDRAGRWLVTASNDKSLRVWELPAGRLVRTIRPPIGGGNEGRLDSVAISPDGSIIACGGWTGFNNQGSTDGPFEGHNIYLFNRASGKLIARITGLPDVISHLAFSPDGRYLATSLIGHNGIRIFHTSNWSLAGVDKEYGSDSYSAHFSRDNRLVTASLDGCVRLYDLFNGSLRLLAKVKAHDGGRPYAVSFSPDASRVAVGYENSTNVSVLSGRDLSLLYSPDTIGVQSGDLVEVAWSADGYYLFAAGQYKRQFEGVWKRAIRRWSDGGRGSFSNSAAADATIMDLALLPDGRLVYCTGDPAFGLLDQDGQRLLFVPAAIANYRDSQDKFLVSNDGSTVGFGYKLFGKYPATFDLATRNLTQGSAPVSLHAPVTSAAGLAIDGWKNTTEPKLNGSPLKLNKYEIARSLAIAPDAQSFVLGTDWCLRRFDHQGHLLWRVQVPVAVRAVNIAGNGSVVVVAYGDGTIRWHRLSDGKELLAFFPHADKKRWVLWTPSGYYDASTGGEELIGWHLNNGKDHAADFFPAAKFRSIKYRPDVIAKVLPALNESEALRLANIESGRLQQTAMVAQLLPPVVSIIGLDDGARVSSSSVTIRYTTRTPADAPVTGVRVLIDGRPVATERGIKVVAKDKSEQSVTVTIPEKDCEVSVIAENRNSSSDAATVRLVWAGRKQEEFTVQPKLYVLAVGVSAYKDPDLKLRYAAKDARDFAAAVQKQKGGMYRDVVIKTLVDAIATRDDVMDGLDWLQKEVTARDVGIIFIAGHGVNDPTGIYYYLPQNADTEKLKRTGVAFSDIKNTLASLAGKAVLFVDTCHSGNVMGTRRGVADINAVVNELASTENGTVVFASSTGKQYSLEDDKWGNGAFTKALVEGISGKADFTGKGRITINMLDLYLSERVKELTGGQQTPTTTKPQTIQDFPLAVRR